MKSVILFNLLFLALAVSSSSAKSLRRSSRDNLKARQNNADLAEEFESLPPETKKKITKMVMQMSKSGQLSQNGMEAAFHHAPNNYHPRRKSPYQLRDEAFYGGGQASMNQQPMIAGPDPFYQMRGLGMDTTKLDKIFDRWDEEAAAKAAQGGGGGIADMLGMGGGGGAGGGGGGMEGVAELAGLAMKFAPMLMAFG